MAEADPWKAGVELRQTLRRQGWGWGRYSEGRGEAGVDPQKTGWGSPAPTQGINK